VPELAGKSGVQAETLRRYLNRLTKGGLIREKSAQAHVCLFQPDPRCPVYAELLSLVVKLAPRVEEKEIILIVEDQTATAQITRILLESWGYEVLESHGPDEAVALFDARRGGVHLLLTDVMMPGMSGGQLANELCRRNPDLRVVYMSGYSAEQLPTPGAAFLPKPFNPASLSRMIRRELDRHPSRKQMKSS
jgi:CheY-like chemotaxis protein